MHNYWQKKNDFGWHRCPILAKSVVLRRWTYSTINNMLVMPPVDATESSSYSCLPHEVWVHLDIPVQSWKNLGNDD